MLPAFFTPTVAVANHGESGESVAAANDRGRFAKIMSLIKPGDVFVVQFGHNDMKEMARDPQAPTKYRDGLVAWARAVKAMGASAVIVTPMNRHSFRDGSLVDSLAPYPQMAREAARESGAVLIDLNVGSKLLYEALGETPALALFKHNADGSGRDATHHSPYGAYQLAKIVVEGLRGSGLPIARAIRPDLPRFDPARPDALAAVAIPPSPTYTDQRPLGD
jgi:lysophospholipase L1-like esterase